MVILALDSGLEKTGYAVFKKKGANNELIDFGLISTAKKSSLKERLRVIYQKLERIIKKEKPDLMAVEEIFFNTNQKTAISIAQAQGISLYLAAKHKIEVEFLKPLQIKKTLTGYGRADKRQVEKMVKILLTLEKIPKSDDVVDAIACGLAYCNIKKFGNDR